MRFFCHSNRCLSVCVLSRSKPVHLLLDMSFIEVAADSHFPIQNLPYGIFSTKDNVSDID